MTLLPGGRDQQISAEQTLMRHFPDAAHPWVLCECGVRYHDDREWAQHVASLLPDEAAIRADERAKLKDALLKFSVVMAHGNGYRADAIPKSSLLDVFALAER